MAPKLVKMCVTLQHYMLNLACHDSVNGNEVRFFYAADNRYSKYHDRLRFLPVGSTRRARDHNPVISGLFSFKYVFLWQKMSFFQRKNVSFWRGVFSGNSHFNCWCIFSDIYDSPHCKRVGEQSSVWIGRFQQKILEIWPPKKISVSLHISFNFHLQH